MKWLRVCFCFWALMGMALAARAQSPDDIYVEIYNVIDQADQHLKSGQADVARQEYLDAQQRLQRFKAAHPGWNKSVVDFRLRYVQNKLAQSQPQPATAPGTAAAPTVKTESTNAPPAIEEAPAPPAPVKPAPAAAPKEPDPKDRQIQELDRLVQQLRNEKGVLETKLKEAWAAQPATIDPRELAKAEDKIKLLEKENALLKVTLDQAQAEKAQAVDQGQLQQMQKSLADAKSQFEKQTETLTALQREKEILDNRVKMLETETQRAKALGQENESLKQQLASAQKAAQSAAQSERAAADAAEAKAALEKRDGTIASLKAELDKLQMDKQDLEKKLASATSSPKKITLTGNKEQIQKLEAERDDLAAKLADATKQLQVRAAAPAAAATAPAVAPEANQFEYLTNQLANLRARLDVYEAKKVPYTSEELALMKQPALTAATHEEQAARRTIRVPSGSAALVQEAERAFKAGRFEDAERNYQQILRLDEKNVFTLRNLAAVQFNLHETKEAEATLKKALAEDPSDPSSLSLWGILKFENKDYDEALNALSRAAQLDPENAETQNYLGITLSQKGLRAPAETALRKALQIAPNYASAHYNLAVVYATQDPPFRELARWHYQKALANNEKRNPEVEKLIEGKQ